MELKRTLDDGIFSESEYTASTAEMVKDLQGFLATPITSLQWIGNNAEFVAHELLPFLIDGAEELSIPRNEHLRDDAPDGARDLIAAWFNCHCLTIAAHRNQEHKFDFGNLTQAFYLGCAIQRWKVRPKAPMVKKHLRSKQNLIERGQRQKIEAATTKEKCCAAMREQQKKLTAGTKVTHAQLLQRVAEDVGCHVNTVKKYCPINPKKK